MKLEEFVEAFAAEFQETPANQFNASTVYKTLDEWGSLTALSIIAMVDEQYDKTITGENLRNCNTIEDLYNFVESI